MTREVIEFPQDAATALSAVALHVYKVAQISGFHENDEDFTNGRFGEFCANLHGEISELWEAYRKGNLNKQCDKPVPLTCAAEELADIIIRAFDCSATLGIDIGESIKLKDQFNQTRPYKHGDKKA